MKTVRPGVEEKGGYDEHGSKSCDRNVVALASDQLNPPGSRARVATTFETSTSMQPDSFSFSTSETGGSGGNVAIAQRIVVSKVFECSEDFDQSGLSAGSTDFWWFFHLQRNSSFYQSQADVPVCGCQESAPA
jgi:hypothetical protein